MVKIATWNVNSIRARMDNTLDWLKQAKPDVVLLQEIKCLTEVFPSQEFEDLGYNVAVYGQKSYNGVAILSKYPIDDIMYGLPTLGESDEARYIEAVICADDQVYRVASVYVPNGTEVDSERFANKLRFFACMREHFENLLEYEEKFIIGGDYNVAPEDIDVYDPKYLRGKLCFHPKEQQQFRAILNTGVTDAFRAINYEKQQFSWWNYRADGYSRNRGMRIDFLLLSPQAADDLVKCEIDELPRQQEKPSDHTPVWVEL